MDNTTTHAQMIEPTFEETAADLLKTAAGKRYRTIYADPPWRFANRTGKVAPEHSRLQRYGTMTTDDIARLPVSQISDDYCHCYLWVPVALIPDGLEVLRAWGFTYKTTLYWEKIRHDGEPDGRGVGFYFRNVVEPCLFGVRTPRKSETYRTLAPGRSQVNIIRAQKHEHSRKPAEFADLIERCSEGPRIELFARGERAGWDVWGNQADSDYEPDWSTYANHTVAGNAGV